MVRRAVGLYAFASGFAIIPESLVAVYALRHLGTSDAGPGILAAAVPIGTIAVSSVVPFHGNARWLLRVAAVVADSGAAVALLFFSVDAELPLLLVGFVGVGVIFASALPTNTVFGSRVPNASRASAFGLAQGVLLSSEGAGAAFGGIVASVWSVRTACIAAMVMVLIGGTAARCGFLARARSFRMVATLGHRRRPLRHHSASPTSGSSGSRQRLRLDPCRPSSCQPAEAATRSRRAATRADTLAVRSR